MNTITKEHLMNLTGRLIKTVTHPSFLARIEAIQKAASTDDQWELIKQSDVAALHADGISIPEGFRMAPRTFENPSFAKTNGIQPPGREPGSDIGEVNPDSYDWSSFPLPLAEQPAQSEAPDVIAQRLKEAFEEISDFVTGAPFCALLSAMAEVAPEQRPAFVLEIVLDEQERIARGVHVPANMTIQRSTFHDGRPTLFCVSAATRLWYPWQKVTFTFDNDSVALAN